MLLSKELVAASSAPLVLSLLVGGPQYGYALIQEVRVRSGGRIEWSEGMLYPVLHRLERQGWIKARRLQLENGRPRRYYEITSKGREQLKRQRDEWMSVHQTLLLLWG
jgi:PadR family transcriptional regulator, regulatory protein PadR